MKYSCLRLKKVSGEKMGKLKKKSVVSRNKGFTMVELMVVVAIIAILSVIGIGGYSSSLKKGRDSRRKSDVQAISQALTLYRMDWGYYPDPDSEYFASRDATVSNCIGGGSGKCHPFGDYIPKETLYDPSSKNFTAIKFDTNASAADFPYTYFCLGGGSTNKCKAYIVCAKLESNSGGNVKIMGGALDVLIKGNGKAIPDSNIFYGIVNVGTKSDPGVDNQWYCAQSS